MMSSSDKEPIAQIFYRSQVTESKIGWIVSIFIIALLVGTILAVGLSLRGHYIALVEAFGGFGMMCAVGHTYPFLASLFFKNPNTPDIVMSVFYGITGTGADGSNTLQWANPTTANNNGWDNLVNVTAWRDTIGTIVWYSENNYGYGYEEVITQWATTTKNFFVGTPPSVGKEVLNGFMSYGLPIINTVLMLAMMAL